MHQRLISLTTMLIFLIARPLITQCQVIAGIRANGKIMNNGDTLRVCLGSTVTYQSVGQGALNIEWQFNGGLPATGTGINPLPVQYSTGGFDTTWQKITGGGITDSMFLVVEVSAEKPLADFNFTPDNVCGNIPILFNNLSTGNRLSYLWTFSPSHTSTEQDPAYPFLEAIGLPGTQTFAVKLETTNLYGCKDSITKTVTVKKVPDASIGNADPAVNFGIFNGVPTFKKCNIIPFYTFSFTNQSTTADNNFSYTIKWGDHHPDSTFTSWPAGVVIKHAFPLGCTMMTIQATGSDGCIGIKTYTIFLGSNPAGGLASLGNTDICSSDSLRFSINGALSNPPGTLYTFLINDGTGEQSFLHPPPAIVGHYFNRGSCGNNSNNGISVFENSFGAYLTIQNPCGTTSPSVVPIYVSGKPKALISIPSPSICLNTTVTINNNSQYGSLIHQASGTTATCLNTGKQVWTISPATGYTITNGSLGSLNGSSINGQLWTNGSNAITVTFTATGTYAIKIYVFNERCGLDSTVQAICVRNPPQADFTMNSKNSCGPGNVVLTNTSPAGSCFGDEYLWSVRYDDPHRCNELQGPPFAFINGTTNTTASPAIQLNLIGRYIIRLSVSGKNTSGTCPAVYKEDTFYVKGVPKVDIRPLPATCVNNTVTPVAMAGSCYSTGPIGYEWTFSNGSPASSFNLAPGNILYPGTGTFPVQLKVTDSSCHVSTTATVNVIITPKPVADAGADKSICSGETISIGAPVVSGLTYQWSPVAGLSDARSSNPVLTLIYNGTANDTTYGYKLAVSAGSNCVNEDSVYITVKRGPDMIVQPATAQVCIGNSVQLTVSGADHYNWTAVATLDNRTAAMAIATPLVNTIYQVVGSLNNGCTDTVKVPIQVNPDAKAQFTAAKTMLCSPIRLDTVIKVTTFPAGNGTYTWYVNSIPVGSNTTGAFPVYPVNAAGQTLVVKLMVQSAFGCKPDSMQMSFQTVASVTADFTQTLKTGCGPLQVDFTNTSSSLAGVQFSWNFGNDITSTQQKPGTISFAASPAYNDTTYYITLKAFNGCDTTYHLDSVKVYAPAKARFGVDNTQGCSPFRTRISNTSPGHHTAFYWDFGDGQRDTTYNTGNMFHTWHTGVITTFTVRLIAEKQCGRDTQNIVLLVSPNIIQPQVAVNGNQLSGCTPHTATFNNNSLGAAQLIWNFGDGTPSIITPNTQAAITHTFMQPGNYNISIQLKNNCADTTITRQVTVYATPAASFTLNNSPVCTNYPVTGTNTSRNAQAYEWIWGDGQVTSSGQGSHQYTRAGVYTIKLVAKSVNNFGAACTDTARQSITVVNKIAPQIIVAPGKTCVPYTLRVNAGDATAAQLVQWTFYDNGRAPGTFAATGLQAAYVYNTPGTYKVKLVLQTAAGCLDSTTYDFTVYSSPHVVVQAINPVTCNSDTTIYFTAGVQYAGNEPVQYNWTINGQREGTSNPFVYRFKVPRTNEDRTTFTISVSPENSVGCGDTAQAGTVTLQPLMKPIIEVLPGVMQTQPDYTFRFKDAAPANPNKVHIWDMGDFTRQQWSGREITYKYGDTGTYKVKLLVVDYSTGCTLRDSVKVTILHIPGYLQVPNAICPGCSNAGLRHFLPMGKGLSQYRLRIFSGWGQLLFETTSLDANGCPNQGWDGRVNGKPIQQDAYQWQIEAKYKNGTEWKGMLFPGSNQYIKSGFVTVVK
jgi:PKD repeat protein